MYKQLLYNIIEDWNNESLRRETNSVWEYRTDFVNEIKTGVYTLILVYNGDKVYQKIYRPFNLKVDEDLIYKRMYFDITRFGLSSIIK